MSQMRGFGAGCRKRFFSDLKWFGIEYYELRELVLHDDPLVAAYGTEAEKALYQSRFFDAEQWIESAKLVASTL